MFWFLTKRPSPESAARRALMNIQECIRQTIRSKELSSAEKLDRLYAIIPADACKIDNLNQATPAQLKQLKDGLAVTEAMQE
jgi:hypothetical protein